MTSDIKREAIIEFVIFNEKGTPENASKVQCIQIGTASLNLQKLLEFDNDLEGQDLIVYDRHFVQIGTIFVTVIAVEALREVLQAARNLEKSQ